MPWPLIEYRKEGYSTVKIIYKDIAPGAKEDVIPDIDDLQAFCNANDLKNDITVPQIATLEQNYWRLDGTFDIMPDDHNGTWGIWSQSMADNGGSFSDPPVLTLNFLQPFSSVGITFYFDSYGPDWCNDLNIQWYSGETVLNSMDFEPDSTQFTCLNEIKNYDKVIITFQSMNRPYRFLKLHAIDLGWIREYGPDELRNVSLYQAISTESEEVEINTLDFTLSSHSPVPLMFQRKQPLEVYHNDVLQGVFYISQSKRTGNSIYEVEANDLIGLLSESKHMGGMYSNTPIATVVADVMGTYEYELDYDLSIGTLSGWLPIASRRDNLAQVAFAIGAVVDTSGSKTVRIYRRSATTTSTFDSSRIYSGGDTEKSALVTRVDVTEHSYTASNETKELFRQTVANGGIVEVTFSEPIHSLQITDGQLINSGANYAVIQGTGHTVVLSGGVYNHITEMVTILNPDININDFENIIQVTNATLVSPLNSSSVAHRLYNKYRLRDKVNARVILNDEHPGDRVSIETEFDGQKTGIIESLDVSLSRKRTGQAVILCQ